MYRSTLSASDNGSNETETVAHLPNEVRCPLNHQVLPESFRKTHAAGKIWKWGDEAVAIILWLQLLRGFILLLAFFRMLICISYKRSTVANFRGPSCCSLPCCLSSLLALL